MTSKLSKEAVILRDANLRLCRIRIWTNYDGLGFQLESLSKPPHIVQLVEPYSPATVGGLKISDVILSVNNQDVSSSDYNQVISIINTTRKKNGFIELLVIQQSVYQSLRKKYSF